MARPKKDPALTTVSYNAENVQRAIGYFTALLNLGKPTISILSEVAEHYQLTFIELAILQSETSGMIAPQFRTAQATLGHQQALEKPVISITDEVITPIPEAKEPVPAKISKATKSTST